MAYYAISFVSLSGDVFSEEKDGGSKEQKGVAVDPGEGEPQEECCVLFLCADGRRKIKECPVCKGKGER